jgi:hypothetical protein
LAVGLKDLLGRKRARIEEQFFNRIASSYPEETASFLTKERDPFLNPVGTTIKRETKTIINGLIDELPADRLTPSIEQIVKITAVQDFTASEAVSFLLFLKEVIRDELQPENVGPGLNAELDHLTRRIDALMLIAFDLYVACRDKIKEIRLIEAQKERDRLLRLLQALTPIPGHRS